jgi:hypothetical protein
MTEAHANWSVLLGLQQRAMEVADDTELAFLVANETWHLLPYRQAAVFWQDRLGRPQLKVVSGLVSTLEDTPFTLWLAQVCDVLSADPEARQQARTLTAADLPEALRDGWAEWWPEQALYQPLVTPSGKLLGVALYVRDEAWLNEELALLGTLHTHYAYCLNTFRQPRLPLREHWRKLRANPKRLKQIAIGLAVLLLFPVRLSVLAPAEIIALKAEAVAAPTDGVVKTFHVQPNQPVKAGQPLFSLDDTTLRNRRDIAQKTLAVARSDALAAGQKAFDSMQSKAELATLQGRVREKEAELSYLDELLGRIDVHAKHDGVFIYGDPNDWIGKPVVTGERIAQLAEPDELGALVWVPVGDAIALEVGASMRVYLQVAPLSALSGELIQTSYQATLSPENVASYRIRGKLADGERAHIGLRGVAKVYGGWRPMIYWVLRRPLGALRQWIGL